MGCLKYSLKFWLFTAGEKLRWKRWKMLNNAETEINPTEFFFLKCQIFLRDYSKDYRPYPWSLKGHSQCLKKCVFSPSVHHLHLPHDLWEEKERLESYHAIEVRLTLLCAVCSWVRQYSKLFIPCLNSCGTAHSSGTRYWLQSRNANANAVGSECNFKAY